MVMINRDLVCRKRLELGWTPEKLAEEAGLDGRTVRRMERGGTEPRLQSAIDVARALDIKLTTLIVDDHPDKNGLRDNAPNRAKAVAAGENEIQREVVIPDDWSVKESLYVLSMFFARSLVEETHKPTDKDEVVDRVVTAFKAADSAIVLTLSGGGDWGAEEVMQVLSRLLARYGTAFSGPSPKGLEKGIKFVQATCEQAKQALPHYEGRK
ncbi:MAG: helix-turn-helix transcriptional regulator [Deltaproteobacteria bacterium]|nr:helix-turn-helix transcriptional regulator [Deltaproteobacteria bacterium]